MTSSRRTPRLRANSRTSSYSKPSSSPRWRKYVVLEFRVSTRSAPRLRMASRSAWTGRSLYAVSARSTRNASIAAFNAGFSFRTPHAIRSRSASVKAAFTPGSNVRAAARMSESATVMASSPRPTFWIRSKVSSVSRAGLISRPFTRAWSRVRVAA